MVYLKVRKSDLPLPVVIEDENGSFEVLSLEPAGKKRLGARLGLASDDTAKKVRREELQRR